MLLERLMARERERERERERLSFEKCFYSRYTRGNHLGEIWGFPIRTGQWCTSQLKTRVLDSFAKGDLRELLLPHSEEEGFDKDSIRWEDNRISAGVETVVQFETKSKSTIPLGFSQRSLAQGADTNIVQYLGIAADEPERIKRHTKPGYILPLVDIGWDEAYCRKWCEENDLLSPIYTSSARGGCWFCHNQGIPQLRLLRRDYPDLWQLLLKWDSDSPVTFHPDGRTVHDFDKRFAMEDAGLIDPNKRFYWKYLDKGELQMATKKTETPIETATMNVWQKLLASRMDFLKQKVKQSGVNLHAEFTYFELKDIVPVATDIFAKYNCVFLTTFPEGKAVGKLVNLDNIEEIITVEFEARSIAEPAKFRMNEVQGLGAEITYMRRYLYFLILDIVVADDFDGESGKKTEDDDVPAPTTTKKKPVTAEKREEIKQELTSPEANADELQINALKAALRNLREIDPSKEEFIQQIALKTEGFTVIKKSACEQLILTIGEMIENYNIEEE